MWKREVSRSDFQWRFTDGETKTNDSGEGETLQLGDTQSVEHEGKSSAGRPGECRRRTRLSNKHKETCAPKAQKSKVLKWGDRNKLKFQILGNRTAGRYLRTLLVQRDLYGQRLQQQSFKLVNVHVFVNECSHSSWTELFGEPGGVKEHELRGNSEFVRYRAEIDIGALWIWRDYMWIRFTAPLHPGHDPLRLMMNWSSGQKRRYLSTLIPYYPNGEKEW